MCTGLANRVGDSSTVDVSVINPQMKNAIIIFTDTTLVVWLRCLPWRWSDGTSVNCSPFNRILVVLLRRPALEIS